jgi:hypothetical protein
MNHIIDIAIPHVEKLAQWDELRFALRSIAKNYKGEVRIWIVGDKPKWLSRKANYIKVPHTGKSPRPDVIAKIQALISNEGVNEEFFWSNDDIYFVNKVTYADLCVPKVAAADLKQKVLRITDKTVYTADVKATLNALMKANLPFKNYSTHLPYRFEKTKMTKLIHDFDLENARLLPENLYYNRYHADELPYALSLEDTNCLMFSINRPNPNWMAVQTNLKTKKWMNNSESGMTPRLQEILLSLFPEPSPWEK